MSSVSDSNAPVLGPYLLGYLLNYGLHGILTVQIYIYYNAFPKDNPAVQAIVYGVYAMEMTQTIMITWDAFHLFVFGFGNLDTASIFTWLDCFLIDGAVAFVAQAFFAYRIYLLSKSKPLTGAIIVVWLGGSAICDIVIAVLMIRVTSKYDLQFQKTKSLVKRIVRLTVGTGGLTAVVATITLVLFVTTLNASGAYICGMLILAKVYSKSMMVILNSRVNILGGRGQSTMGGENIIISDTNLPSESKHGREQIFDLHPRVGTSGHHPRLNVEVRQEVEVDIVDDQSSAIKFGTSSASI
ncbi:hypothetical protein L218DRAFT_945074 [Marasmius fiardii PR-910]|nr:hypothetical protein L218DRAFT_945074 [Marasmius fiardii PR-910]